MSLDQNYNPAIIEKKWQQYWEQKAIFRFDFERPRSENFVVDTPPPTVSGTLHMGHVFSYTQTDIISRFKRMCGFNVFYPMGFDDNGLPTERLVEKMKNVRANQMPRAEFVALCKEVVQEAEEEFRTLFRTLALSIDWTQEYQTISRDSMAISQASFLDLVAKDEAYRNLQPTLWDVVDQTALAQAEVEDKEKPGEMLYVNFHSLDAQRQINGHIQIATTRPEYLPACVALLCNPEDKRYKHLIGTEAATPLFNVIVPILADSAVEPEKGSGMVMCCTFGDITDVDWWRKFKLPLREIMGRNGRLQGMETLGQAGWESLDPARAQEHVQAITGTTIAQAKEYIATNFVSENLLIKRESLLRPVKCAERSGAALEIILSPQWFVRVMNHKEALLARASECAWHPSYMRKRVEQWINGLNWDWCISRQRYFGVPFPVWYSKRAGEEGRLLFAQLDDLPVDPFTDLPRGYSSEEVSPDPDVMDTWATSSVTPQLASRGINANYCQYPKRYAALFPADMRPQAHEIIRTWAFYTIVKAHLHANTIPWYNLMISGWCLAADKTKMSKSKGNIVTPTSMIEEKGTDVVRYWSATSKLGADIVYSDEVFKIGRKLTTKLWNAGKFAELHIANLDISPTATANTLIGEGKISATLDLWLLGKLQQTVTAATKAFNEFEYSVARMAIEDFFWNDLCDNYLEIIKVRVYDAANDNPEGKLSAALTLYFTFEALLKLFAPILPHICEELYAGLFPKRHAIFQSIHAQGTWPAAGDYPQDKEALESGEHVKIVIELVRRFKTEANISLRTALGNLYILQNHKDGSTAHPQGLESCQHDLQAVCNATALHLIATPPQDSAHELTTLTNDVFTIYVNYENMSNA